MSLDYLNNNYPCTKRIGYATGGCNCSKKKTDTGEKVNTNLIQCSLYGKVALHVCKDCNYQEKEVKKLIEENKK